MYDFKIGSHWYSAVGLVPPMSPVRNKLAKTNGADRETSEKVWTFLGQTAMMKSQNRS